MDKVEIATISIFVGIVSGLSASLVNEPSLVTSAIILAVVVVETLGGTLAALWIADKWGLLP